MPTNKANCSGHCACGMAEGEIGEYCRECERKIGSCGGDNPFCGNN